MSDRRTLGVILAGGSSSRFGGVPKGLELVGGRRIIDRVADALRPVTSDLVLSANHPDAEQWLPGVPVLADMAPGAGGLGGVQAGLTEAAKHDADLLVVAWDMPFVPSAVLGALTRLGAEHDADVVAPASDSPHGFEPFCAWYHGRLLAAVQEFLRAGGGPAHAFASAAGRLYVAGPEEFPDASQALAPHWFLSVNTVADLARARTLAPDAR